MSATQSVFDAAHLYDLAFSYRDYGAESDHLQRLAAYGLGRPATSCLEVAAGPARHAIALARQGVRAAAVDLSAAMCRYAEGEARNAGVEVAIHEGDMRSFVLKETAELAFLLLNSISHLHTFEDLERHFTAVRASLADPGVYVIEVQHPRDFVGRGPRSTGVSQPWVVEQGSARLTARWGRADDPYDPMAQVFSAHVALDLEQDGHHTFHEDVVRMRDWTRGELLAAARFAGLGLVHAAGDLDPSVGLDSGDASWRMVLVLGTPAAVAHARRQP